MITNDPTMVHFVAHCARVMDLVESGQTDRHTAMGCLIADALASSLSDAVPPDVADEFLNMASSWAVTRARALREDALVWRYPVPDDVSALVDPEGEGT